MRLIFLEPQLLQELAEANMVGQSVDCEELRQQVRQAVENLNTPLKEIVIMRHFEGQDYQYISGALGIIAEEVKRLEAKAMVKLRNELLAVVKSRWPKQFANLKACPICVHPMRKQIEQIAFAKRPHESWRKVNRRLKTEVGTSFHPPKLIMDHLRLHMKRSNYD